MKKSRKLLALLLTLALTLSLLGGSFAAFAEEEPLTTIAAAPVTAVDADPFKTASKLESGYDYLIVTEYEGKTYAFAYNEALCAEELDPASYTGTTAVWNYNEDALESAGTEGTFIYAGSYGLMTYSTGREFAYDAENKVVLMHNMYYLTFDGTSFNQSKEAADACTVTLYRRPIPGTVVSADYKAAADLKADADVMLVTEYEGKTYAFAYDEALCAEEVAVADGVISYKGGTAVWNLRDGESLENIGAEGVFIYAGSYGLMTYSTGREFAYDAENKAIIMHNMYYLTFDGTSFSQSKEAADACAVTVYEKVNAFKPADALTVGDQFLFVTKYEDNFYAFAYTGEALAAEQVTFEGANIIPETDTVKWYARDDEALESVGSAGTFIYSGSYGLMTYSTGREFAYVAETKNVLMHNMYYLTFDGTAFGQSKEAADAAEILLFKMEMPKNAAEDKFVPADPEFETVVRDSVKNADGDIVLAFASDIHYATTYAENDVQIWLENLEESVGYIDAMGFCGDMGSAYSATPADYWTNVQGVFDYMDNYQVGKNVGTAIYTFGNHEWYPSAGGDYTNNYENETTKRYIRVGEGLRTPEYIIYCLGAGSIAAKMSQGYSDEDIAQIDAYLSTAPTDIPIFVLTHFPIHCWTDRLSKNADKLIATLNKYPNIVVLWGHNHTDFDPNYDVMYHAGDVITIDNKGTTATLNFDYMSAGCTSDAQYTDVSGGSAWVQGKGLVVTIKADGTLDYAYYTRDGVKMPENGPYVVEFREGANYTTLDVQFVEEGKAAVAPAVPEVTNYVFGGWDTEFDCITGHTVVTAQYTYETGLDKNYVYLTVETKDGIAIGKSGAPILNYAVPYKSGMSILDAFKALQEAEYVGGGKDLTSGGYGYITNPWGCTPSGGAYVMVPSESACYLSATTAAEAGNVYYIMAYTEDADRKYTSYLSPYTASAKAGEKVAMFGEYWIFNTNTNKFENFGLNGDVYMGTSLDKLSDTGIDAVDGKFSISFDKAGTYYVVVKSDVADAATTITVTGSVAKEDPKVITPATPDGKVYVVAAGDTLWSIAKRYYGNGNQWGKILEANYDSIPNGNPRALRIGTALLIP